MHESRSLSGFRRTVGLVGAFLGVALLSAGVAIAADPVQLKSRLGPGSWCLDGPNGNKTAMVVNPCDGSKSQLWVFNSAGQIESAAFPGGCMSISGAADATPVMLVPCQASANNQRWTAQPNAQLTNELGPCLNIFGGVAAPGTPVIGYRCLVNVEDEQWDSVS
jgi:hypothetical protein